MTYQTSMIKLKLEPGEATLARVYELEGLKDLNIDESFGLICISPKRNLYTIRVSGDVDRDALMAVQTRVKGVYGEVKISQISEK